MSYSILKETTKIKAMSNNIILSLIQPTGDLHYGNYFGAIKNWVDIQNSNQFKCNYGIADYHAMTLPYRKEEFSNNIQQMLFDLMACGINLEKSNLFVQSLVPEHTELYWILGTIAPYGELRRMTQFKDKVDQINEQRTNVSLGLFAYPVLQAADILIYNANHVPVGVDQLQHLELSRNIAKRFNKVYKSYFTIPEAKLTKFSKLMSLADPSKKMSKSLGEKHYLGLFEDKDTIKIKVYSAVTDKGDSSNRMSPGVQNLLELLLALEKFEEHSQFLHEIDSGTIKYKHLKEIITNSINELNSTFIERRKNIMVRKNIYINEIYEISAMNRKMAQQRLKEVREIVGLPNLYL